MFGVIGFCVGLTELALSSAGAGFKFSIATVLWHLVFITFKLDMSVYLYAVIISYFLLFFIAGVLMRWLYIKIKNRSIHNS